MERMIVGCETKSERRLLRALRVRAYLSGAVVAIVLGAIGAPPCRADLQEIKERGTLRVVVSSNTDPDFYDVASEDRPGLLREVLLGFAELHDLRVETRESSSRERAAELQAGRCDVVALTSNERDAARMVFSEEVFPKNYVVVTRQPGSVVRSVEDLEAETVGVFGRNRGAVLEALGVPYTEMESDDASLAAIQDGSTTATIVSLDNALNAQRADPAFQIGMFVGPTVGHVFGVRKDDPVLLQALNDYIGNLRLSGAWQRLVVKYFGSQVIDILRGARESEQ
jgi:polar amino acid transport system substrate-binding protein